MASKIFMGDMPELMENILDNLKNEFYSLYSCALVSRHWCKISIPILWQDPFSLYKNSLFISKYFSPFGEDEKFILKYMKNAEISKTLFDYARFLKVLDLYNLENNVKNWIDFHRPYMNSPDYGASIYHIINILLKIFIESGATLHKLELYFSEYIEIKPEVFHSLERNEQFLSRLKDLTLSVISELCADNATALLKVLAKTTTKINTLKLDEFYSYYEPQVFHSLICIINSQEQLRRFIIIGDNSIEFPAKFHGIILALESQKQSLQEVIVQGCICNAEFKVLMKCENLEILRIRNCKYAELLALSSYKSSTLEIVDSPINTSNMALIFEKFGTFLQRLKLGSDNEMVLKRSSLLALKSFCPNITYLNISYIEFSTQLLDLIGNLQKLQFLTLRYLWYIDDVAEEQVMLFAEMLPLTLQYLDLRDCFLNSYIDILLSNCYAPLKKLLIYRLDNEKKAKALIEFSIRKRTLNYVAVSRHSYLNNDLKNTMKEYVTLVPYGCIDVDC
ncbi:11347_t:CDS:1 [Cetraspora pellucida]|uniref:11347_t:CDS:1 n=1 Tax=Cetraspora pellucida TaxID=1433469 RepID=A0ACA9L5F7_9GLOM|nr:11347_t:CDS:1 [Cetraspora pellucida]